MKKVATIILNRNLPEITDQLYEHIQKYDGDLTDIYVVESGSDKSNLSKYCSFYANWDDSLSDGLRYPRGFNYGFTELIKEKKFDQYDYFFLVCNDTQFEHKATIAPLVEEMETHKRLGILSPTTDSWGENQLLKENETKYFWYVNHVSWLVRKDYILDICELENPTYLNFLYDGSNFRGYESDIELVVKAYANDWAAGITSKVKFTENESLLRERSDTIKTDSYDENIKKLVNEGNKWLRRKYGFNNRWSMQLYAKMFYENFFKFFPQDKEFKI